MRKYNLSKIMKRAWEFVKKAGLSISEGLKRAWKEAKSLKKALTAKLEMLANLHEGNGWHYKVVVSDWENYGKNRTYFSVIETRDHSKRCVKYDCGYFDNTAEKYIPGKCNLQSNFNLKGNKLKGQENEKTI